jgi:hypothetical protein
VQVTRYVQYLTRYVQHPINCVCGRCNNTARSVMETIEVSYAAHKDTERMKRTLEHIASGRCSNPRQCARECLDGDIDPDYGL